MCKICNQCIKFVTWCVKSNQMDKICNQIYKIRNQIYKIYNQIYKSFNQIYKISVTFQLSYTIFTLSMENVQKFWTPKFLTKWHMQNGIYKQCRLRSDCSISRPRSDCAICGPRSDCCICRPRSESTLFAIPLSILRNNCTKSKIRAK